MTNKIIMILMFIIALVIGTGESTNPKEKTNSFEEWASSQW
jgi:hypothetical protein